MAAFSRGFRSFSFGREFICVRCRKFTITAIPYSGHNRWSKIKHDKGAADAKKNVQRSMFSKEIALASKLYGSDPNSNPRLATILATAKKAGFPKASMDAAIARGQGRSATGAALENVTLEAIMPPQIALIIEAETDSKTRLMMDLRVLIKKFKGSVSSTSYLFERKGRIVFERVDNLGVDEVLDEAIEAGAEDVVTDEEGSLTVWTDPTEMVAAGEMLTKTFGLKIESQDIIWDAKEDTKVALNEAELDAAKAFGEFLEQLQEESGILGVYANASQGSLKDELWANIQSNLDA